MLFNSIEFAIFLPFVFLIYWAIGYARINDSLKLRLQNAFVVLASYVFYGWWDWRFLILIAFTSFCSWGSGLLIVRKNGNDTECLRGGQNVLFAGKFWLVANIVLNLGILATFKYYDFFVSELGHILGISTDSLLLRIILPVGISFYTFQALSYSIDVYRGNIKPTKDIIAFFAFISFFPQLVAGPIERATNLLPQFLQKRTFSYGQGVDGIRQIIWGLFEKMVVADSCAVYVNRVFEDYANQNASTLLIAAILFTFQIYGDFSGYSDIAIGTAKLFGIRLMRNFNNPYFSRDIAEFWRRWHISLTTWFRDYVYIPLGGSRVGKWKIVRNTFVIFLLSGIWHGANWTFLAWGAFHAALFLPLILLGKNRKYTNNDATLRDIPKMLLTFAFAVIGWIIFRAETIGQAWEYMMNICDISLFTKPVWHGKWNFLVACIGIVVMIMTEWHERKFDYPLQKMGGISIMRKPIVQIISLMIFFFLILLFRGGATDFIYFQF